MNQRFEINQAKLGRDLAIRRVGRVGLLLNPIFTYFFLWAPILLLVVFSFNNSRGVSVWRGFTFDWYINIFDNTIGSDASFSTGLLLSSVTNSLIVAVATTIFATLIGTATGLAFARTRFPGQNILDAVLYLPIVIPEITQGISLVVFFKIVFDWYDRITGVTLSQGFVTIILAHVTFTMSYVMLVVRARLANMNPRYEEAARDLGANEWQTFWRVTFPLIFPGVLAGGLLAFTLSLDDYVITFFTTGSGTNTLPMFVYGLLRTSVTPEVNALSTLMLIASTILIAVSLGLQGRNAADI
ncbi:MAG: ABC transporter permease [Phototrophicaceae bacterium]